MRKPYPAQEGFFVFHEFLTRFFTTQPGFHTHGPCELQEPYVCSLIGTAELRRYEGRI